MRATSSGSATWCLTLSDAYESSQMAHKPQSASPAKTLHGVCWTSMAIHRFLVSALATPLSTFVAIALYLRYSR